MKIERAAEESRRFLHLRRTFGPSAQHPIRPRSKCNAFQFLKIEKANSAKDRWHFFLLSKRGGAEWPISAMLAEIRTHATSADLCFHVYLTFGNPRRKLSSLAPVPAPAVFAVVVMKTSLSFFISALLPLGPVSSAFPSLVLLLLLVFSFHHYHLVGLCVVVSWPYYHYDLLFSSTSSLFPPWPHWFLLFPSSPPLPLIFIHFSVFLPFGCLHFRVVAVGRASIAMCRAAAVKCKDFFSEFQVTERRNKHPTGRKTALLMMMI